MTSIRPADTFWLALAAAVTAYEVAACRRSDWELLCEALDRHRIRHRVAVDTAVGYLALHLLRRWPARFDPLAALADRLRQ